MNIYIFIAGILCFILGLVHSVLGEYLIFKNKKHKGHIIPSKKMAELKEPHLRIIWATWHLASIFGWCIGAMLLKISFTPDALNSNLIAIIIQSIIYSMFSGSLLVLIATKGKHPGWVVLLIIGILLIIGK